MNSLRNVREHMRVERTPNGRGHVLKIEVWAYDNGFIHVNRTPMNADTSVGSWLSTGRFIAQMLEVFEKDYASEPVGTMEDGTQVIFHPHGSGPFAE